MFVLYWCFFFFKQKPAYELRISDWSSDVCSSDLRRGSSHHEVDPQHHTAGKERRKGSSHKNSVVSVQADTHRIVVGVQHHAGDGGYHQTHHGTNCDGDRVRGYRSPEDTDQKQQARQRIALEHHLPGAFEIGVDESEHDVLVRDVVPGFGDGGHRTSLDPSPTIRVIPTAGRAEWWCPELPFAPEPRNHEPSP